MGYGSGFWGRVHGRRLGRRISWAYLSAVNVLGKAGRQAGGRAAVAAGLVWSGLVWSGGSERGRPCGLCFLHVWLAGWFALWKICWRGEKGLECT